MLIQTYFWDHGLGIELTEQVMFLHYSPNRDVDIAFDRLTLKWTFLNDNKVRPFVEGGGSLNYVITRVAGQDLFDQQRNPDYDLDDSDDADSAQNDDPEGFEPSDEARYLTDRHEWGMAGWFPGYHAVAGVQILLKKELALSVTVRYEGLPIESLDVKFVFYSSDQWHWKKRKLTGDAGGLGASVGVTTWF